MIEPYYHDEKYGITIYLGGCLEIIPQLEPVDLVLTDPPYGISNNCSYSRFSKGGNDWKDIQGDNYDFDPTFLLSYKECILWGVNNYNKHIPRGTWLVWQKYSKTSTFQSDAEIGWMKGGRKVLVFSYNMHPIGEFPSDSSRARFHPTEKPVCLMKWCIEKLRKGIILDPFMGSGTTLVAAKQLGRKAIGIEIEEKYAEIAARRLQQDVFQWEAK